MMWVCNAAHSDRRDSKCQANQRRAYSIPNSIVSYSTHTELGLLHLLLSLLAQALLSALQERRERRVLDVEEAAVAAAAAASAQSSKHDPAKGQWDFAQRAQRAALAEEQAATASGVRSNKKGQHQRHGSASDREGPVHRQAAEVPSPPAPHREHVLQTSWQLACCLVNRAQTPIVLTDALCDLSKQATTSVSAHVNLAKDAYIGMLHMLVVISAGISWPCVACQQRILWLMTVCAVA